MEAAALEDFLDSQLKLTLPWGDEELFHLSPQAAQLVRRVLDGLLSPHPPAISRRYSLQLAKLLGLIPWGFRPLPRSISHFHNINHSRSI